MVTIVAVLLMGAFLVIALTWVTKRHPIFRFYLTIFLSYLFLLIPFSQFFALPFSAYGVSQALKISKNRMGIQKFILRYDRKLWSGV